MGIRGSAKKAPTTPPVEDENESTAVDIDEIETDAKTRRKLLKLAEEAADYANDIAGLDALKKQVVGEMQEIAESLGLTKIRTPHGTVGEVAGRPSLKKELLLEEGVTLQQIKNATVTGESYWQFNRPRAKKG